MRASAPYDVQNRTVPRKATQKKSEGSMKKLIFLIILTGSLAFLQDTPALAISLDFVPSLETVFVGQPVIVDIVISGTVAGGPPSIGAFDLDVSFDPHNLRSTAASFGPFLGIPN